MRKISTTITSSIPETNVYHLYREPPTINKHNVDSTSERGAPNANNRTIQAPSSLPIRRTPATSLKIYTADNANTKKNKRSVDIFNKYLIERKALSGSLSYTHIDKDVINYTTP